ncbi:MAG: GNAT family N-acetyltransferase, partial [Cyanobacteria bacterium P01_D01_bin.50]
YHRRGLGELMLGEAIRQSPILGLNTLIGFIFAHNEASLKLFKKFGFEGWGYLPGIADIDGVECDLVILGLRVG